MERTRSLQGAREFSCPGIGLTPVVVVPCLSSGRVVAFLERCFVLLVDPVDPVLVFGIFGPT